MYYRKAFWFFFYLAIIWLILANLVRFTKEKKIFGVSEKHYMNEAVIFLSISIALAFAEQNEY